MQAGQRCIKGYKLCITFMSLRSPLLMEMHSGSTSVIQWLLLVNTVYVNDRAMMYLVLKTGSPHQRLFLT